ncbi:hypothetical protein EN855_033535, partial [Mesorhizobium sp. M1C.F.Ca.ET.212.01.1.1]
MKSKRVAAVLALVMTPSLHARSLPSELAQLGIVAGMPYAKAKGAVGVVLGHAIAEHQPVAGLRFGQV